MQDGLLNALNDLLQPQENLCPGGSERHLNRNRLAEIISAQTQAVS